MNKELQDKLYADYPRIFAQKDLNVTETAMCWGVQCGDGWYNLIDTLCSQIQSYIDQPHINLEMYSKWLEKSLAEDDEELAAFYMKKLRETKETFIPQTELVQIKEKYGSLRFYVTYYDDKINTLIGFAEALSERTCEACGAPGEMNQGGWMKVSCEKCEEE